jgi:hypothetical protein
LNFPSPAVISFAHDHLFLQTGSRCRLGICVFRAILSEARFRYWRDPVCLVACAAYALNRWVFAPMTTPGSFWRNHFDDVLLIPAALPLVLWVQRKLGLRTHDAAPGVGETAFHLAIWALIAEVLGPLWLRRGTADWRDVIAYVGGAAICVILWRSKNPLAKSGIHS